MIAGGTLALAAAAGTPTVVVSLTRGERGPRAPHSLHGGEALADARARELQEAADVLGVRFVHCLRHPDGALEAEDACALAARLAGLLRQYSPGLLLTFGADGLYGHRDHVATRTIATRAAGLLESRPPVLEAVWRPGLVDELVAAAGARGLPVGLWDLSPGDFGAACDGEIATIDVRAAIGLKMRALRAHRSQFAPEHLLAGLPADLATRFLGTETWACGSAGAARALRELVNPADETQLRQLSRLSP